MSVLIAILSLAAGTAADQLTADERQYLNSVIEARDLCANHIRNEIAIVEAQRSDEKRRSKPVPGSPKFKFRARLDWKTQHLQSELASLETGATEPTMPPIGSLHPFEQGSVGGLGGQTRVMQVIGPTDMLVTITGLYRESHNFWIQGFPTKGYADEQPIHLQGVIVVDGTKSYTNVLGAKTTVTRLRPRVINREKVLREYRARCQSPEAWAKSHAQFEPLLKQDAPGPPPNPEDVARKRFSGLLSNSRSLINDGIIEPAKKHLRQIVAEAPGTAIAAQAQKELDQLAK